MAQADLPALTGSPVLDPWRLRYRRQLESGAVARPARRPTRSEIMLWEQLQHSGREWLNEFPTQYGYMLDFYCPAVRLAIEVDGPSHWGQAKAERDAWRDLVHERMGIKTKRFSAREVETEVQWVIAEIEAVAQSRAALLAAESVGEGCTATQPDEELLTDLDDDERVHVFPPDVAGWGTQLPACRTILPTLAVSKPRLGLPWLPRS